MPSQALNRAMPHSRNQLEDGVNRKIIFRAARCDSATAVLMFAAVSFFLFFLFFLQREIGRLRNSIAIISGTEQDIDNRKMALQTTISPASADIIW